MNMKNRKVLIDERVLTLFQVWCGLGAQDKNIRDNSVFGSPK